MSGAVEKGLKKIGITISKPVLAAICIIFGIVIILWPDLVGLLIGIFLILEGVMLLVEHAELLRQQRTKS